MPRVQGVSRGGAKARALSDFVRPDASIWCVRTRPDASGSTSPQVHNCWSRRGKFLHRRGRNRTDGRTRPAATPFFASGRVRTRPIWRVRLPKRCKGCAPQPPNRPVVVQRPTPCNFSTVCSGLGGLCGLCGAKAHTAGQLSPIFVDLGNLWTWGTFGLGELLEVTLGHFSPPPCAKPVAGRTRPAATPFFASGRVRTRPDASGVRCGAQASHHTP